MPNIYHVWKLKWNENINNIFEFCLNFHFIEKCVQYNVNRRLYPILKVITMPEFTIWKKKRKTILNYFSNTNCIRKYVKWKDGCEFSAFFLYCCTLQMIREHFFIAGNCIIIQGIIWIIFLPFHWIYNEELQFCMLFQIFMLSHMKSDFHFYFNKFFVRIYHVQRGQQM